MNYILDFKDSLTSEEIDQYLIDNNITKIKVYSSFSNVYLVSSDSELSTDDMVISVILDSDNPIQLLSMDVDITDSTELSQFEITEDKNWWKVASMDEMDFDENTYTHTVRGSNSTVYILDSGIELNHPEFQNRNITLLHSFTNDFADNRGHGTSLASVIAGNTCGLSNASLKIVKIFENNTPTLQSDIINALDVVLADYIDNGKLPSVVNMSWGIPKNEYINSKIQSMINQGLYVVAAAGNSGIPIGDVTPASIPDVLTVGSYGQNLTPSNFSDYTEPSAISYTADETNYGVLDGWAPGEKIWTAGLNNTYSYSAGTSLSAAITSGALAFNLSTYARDNILLTESVYTNYIDRKNEAMNLDPNYNANWTYLSICLGRPNLLDLTDPKYAASAKQVVTYFTHPTVRPRSLTVQVYENASTKQLVFPRSTTKKITSDSDLPDWIVFDERGMLTINAPSTQDLPYVQVGPITIDIINRNDTTDSITFSVLVKRSDLNKNTASTLLPEDDPVLNIILYYRSCLYDSGCAASTCNDDCYTGFAGYCNYYVYKSQNCCYCSSDIRLKKDIKFVKQVDGINLYSYNYIWEDTKSVEEHMGVIAQELLTSEFKKLVAIDNNGYYIVNHCLLPVSIQECMQ